VRTSIPISKTEDSARRRRGGGACGVGWAVRCFLCREDRTGRVVISGRIGDGSSAQTPHQTTSRRIILFCQKRKGRKEGRRKEGRRKFRMNISGIEVIGERSELESQDYVCPFARLSVCVVASSPFPVPRSPFPTSICRPSHGQQSKKRAEGASERLLCETQAAARRPQSESESDSDSWANPEQILSEPES